MRIIHVSDIHFGCWDRSPGAFFDKRILGQLNYFLRRRSALHHEFVALAITRIRGMCPDVVVLSGDLTCVGSPQEFALAAEALAPLLHGGGFTTIYVPGNHDAYVADDGCRKALQKCFRQLNQERWELDGRPRELRLGNLSLLIVDECRPTNIFSSGGVLPAGVVSHVKDWAAKPRAGAEGRLLVGHFPLRDARGRRLGRRRRLDAADLLWPELAEGRIDVSLAGHVHTPFVRREASGSFEVCAGCLSQFGRINVLDFTPATGKFQQFWLDVTGDLARPLTVGPELAPATAGTGGS